MGYTTYFDGGLSFNKPVTNELKHYINTFSETRRMSRDNDKIKKVYPNWVDLCYNGNLGTDGEYFIGSVNNFGQDDDGTVKDHNHSGTMPGLWCQWIIDDNDELVWDEGEKFYEYTEWLNYLIDNFFAPDGYVLNGEISFQGEDDDDFGVIKVIDNDVEQIFGKRIYSLADIDTDDLINELGNRGISVI